MESLWQVTCGNFSSFLLTNPVAVLYMRASWGVADRYMMFRFSELSHKFPGVTVGVMDVDEPENWDISAVFAVKQIPTVICFTGGRRWCTVEGQQSLLTLVLMARSGRDEALRIEHSQSKRKHLKSRISI